VTEQAALENIQKTDEYRWNILQKKAQDIRVGQAFSMFRSHDIEPILIKGWAATQFYPPTKSRYSVDIDLAFRADDVESAIRISRSPEASGLAIDVHRELRHLDTVEWADLASNSRLIEIETGLVRVLRPEDHLRVLCTHWLTDGGEDRERLWDIYYLVDRRPADFDWDRCLNSVGDIRRRWIVCTIGLAHLFLNLNLDDTPIAKEARDLPEWLVKTIEREWAADNRLVPLEACLNDRKLFFRQFLKRMRANPIQATIFMNGSFDAKTRIFYRIGGNIKRIPSSIRRIWKTLAQRFK
jgi:Uncharacterised nucleotidyltransferase